MQGWIKLHRKILDWEWYDNPVTKSVFIDLILQANHQDNSWHGQVIKKGSLVTSLKSIAQRNGLSNQQVRTALKNLEKTGEINKQSTNKNTLIIVLNYNAYQDIFDDENEACQQTNNKQATNKQQTNNNKQECKECKNDNNVRKRESAFVKPTVQQVQAYMAEKGYSFDVEEFCNHYEANGWKVGKVPMKSWKAAVSNWNKREKQFNRKNTDNGHDIPSTYDINAIQHKAMFNDEYDI